MTSPADVVSAVAPALTERQAFEQWFSDDGQSPRAVERSGEGYRLQAALTAWVVWQARASLSAADARDAARYRWLRVTGCAPKPRVLVGSIYWDTSLDGIIDAAMASEANRGAPAGATAETPPKDQS